MMSKTVLICDDEMPIRRTAEFKLARSGYNVISASDGEEAWELIQQSIPDLLITDCQMPRLDGIGLIRRIRQDERTQSLPIFMLTGKGFELLQDNMEEELQIEKIIPKPFSPLVLKNTVDELFETSCC